jgi:pimeloyl-ACP methyl ester carboxylesterase
LANNGIVVLRFDDRGAGESTPVDWTQFTFHDLSEDALAAIQLLKNYEEVNSEQIGLIGHSLGAAIAPIAASKSEEVAFLVLLGGHGLIGNKTGVVTTKYLGKAFGKTGEEIDENIKLVEHMFQIILAEEGWEEMKIFTYEKIKSNFEKLPEFQKTSIKTIDAYLESTYEGFLLSQGNTPMYRSFLKYDPSSSLSKTFCPVLLLFGDEDILHPPDYHKDIMLTNLRISGNNNINFEVFFGVDHEFTSEESRTKKEFIPELLPTICDWILKFCRK